MHPRGLDNDRRGRRTSVRRIRQRYVCRRLVPARISGSPSYHQKGRGAGPPQGLSKLAPPPRSSARAALFLSGVRRCGARSILRAAPVNGAVPARVSAVRGRRPCRSSARALFWWGAWCAGLLEIPRAAARGRGKIAFPASTIPSGMVLPETLNLAFNRTWPPVPPAFRPPARPPAVYANA